MSVFLGHCIPGSLPFKDVFTEAQFNVKKRSYSNCTFLDCSMQQQIGLNCAIACGFVADNLPCKCIVTINMSCVILFFARSFGQLALSSVETGSKVHERESVRGGGKSYVM